VMARVRAGVTAVYFIRGEASESRIVKQLKESVGFSKNITKSGVLIIGDKGLKS